MIISFFQIECDGCGLGCGGVFRDLANAEGLREALGWVRFEAPVDREEAPVVRHACPPCFRKRNAPEAVWT